jgi:hypothetical protein
MTRVIQDSDDESGSSSPLRLEADEILVAGNDRSVEKAVSATKSTNGTSSEGT